MLGVPAGALLKAFPVVVDGGHGQHAGRGLVLVLVRGDHRVNEIKLTNALGAPWRPARDDEVGERIGPPGFIGPVGADVPVLLDEAVGDGGYVVGANERDHHLRGVEPGRDFAFERVDVRTVEAGDTVGGQPITIEPAIEVGNIFQLGTRYSEPLGATYLDVDGTQRPIVMGSYGIGPARIVAAAVEQFADEKGIAWPRALAPWDVEVVALGKPGSDELAAAEGLYRELRAIGLEVLLDDRELGPGSKFADAELLGCPLRLTVGRRSLQEGAPRHSVAAGCRTSKAASHSREPRRRWPSCGRRSRSARNAERARLTFRRLAGLDRSGPPPPQTLAGPAVARRDDPQRDRLRPPRADPGLPRARPELGERNRRAPGRDLRGHLLERLPRRDRSARDRPVQPLWRAARSRRRPPARRLGPRRLLALRAPAALGDRRPRRRGSCSCCSSGSSRCAAASS